MPSIKAVPINVAANGPVNPWSVNPTNGKTIMKPVSPVKGDSPFMRQNAELVPKDCDKMRQLNAAQNVEILYLKQQIKAEADAIATCSKKIAELEKFVAKLSAPPKNNRPTSAPALKKGGQRKEAAATPRPASAGNKQAPKKAKK